MDRLPLDEAYSPNYESARQRFRVSATAAGAKLSAHPVGATGFTDGALTIDVAKLEARSNGPVVVVSSGLHGVEGFFGSALQLETLARLRRGELELGSTRLFLVHALNPYGFATARRTSEENVDLNRNFLAADESYSGAPTGYAELDQLINAPSPPSRWEPFRLKALARVLRHGESNLRHAIAVGQYDYPEGLFFGGKNAVPVTRLIQELSQTWAADGHSIVHLDLHSGLGRSGECSLLLVEPPEATSIDWYHRHFGPAVQPFVTQGGTAYPARGLMGRWLLEQADGAVYRFVTVEFGTYSSLTVLEALRAENRAHHHSKPGDKAHARTRRTLIECFCPAKRAWRQRVLEQGNALVDRAVVAAGGG